MAAQSVFLHFIHRFVFWILFAMVSCFILRVLIVLDLNKRVYNHTPGPCRVLTESYKGTAGMTFVASQERVYVTLGYGKSHNLTTRTGIAFYSTKRAEAGKNPQEQYDLVEMTINWNGQDESHFTPTGIDSYSSSNGRILLYVISAHPDYQCVHFFQIHENTKLNHRKAICDSSFTSLQDISVVGPDRFFLTNLAAFGRGWPQVIEFAMQTGQGAVYYYDGSRLNVAASVNTPTAIGFDAKKRILYVGSLIRESIYSYKVEKDMSLEVMYEMMLLTSPIGLFVESKSGDLWIAAHPVIHESAYHYLFPQGKVHSSSQVLRIRFQEEGKSWVTTEPYANDGATISASSSVVFHDNQLLIGSSFGRLLHCDLIHSHIT